MEPGKKCPNCDNLMDYDWDDDIFRCQFCTTVIQQVPSLKKDNKPHWI